MYCVLKLTNQALPPSRTDSPTLLRQIHLKKNKGTLLGLLTLRMLY